MNKKVTNFLERAYWIWVFIGCVVMWIAIGVITSSFGFSSLISIGLSASFLIIVALGQMIVITTGRGAIDLSIPSVITLSAFLATGIINGANERLLFGVVMVLAVGAFIGFLNSVLVIYLKIPPIIATLAMGNIVVTLSLLYNKGFSIFKISPLLLDLTRKKFISIPLMIYFMLLIAIIIDFVLRKTTFGRFLIAIGQNIKAAFFSGVKTNLTQVLAYTICGFLASLMGILLSARIGGPFLGMGDSYLLETVGAVVIGGTLIFGGRATVIGTIFGGLFLVLTVTTMQITGLSIGIQQIIKGLLLIVVLTFASGKGISEE